MADALNAIVDVLRSHDIASGRVWGRGLPRDENDEMPRRCVVVRRAGGSTALQGGYLPTVDHRVDIRSYGPDAADAGALDAQIAQILHHLRDTTTDHGRIIWCRTAGGPSDLLEPDTRWPLTLSSWQVYGTWLTEQTP